MQIVCIPLVYHLSIIYNFKMLAHFCSLFFYEQYISLLTHYFSTDNNIIHLLFNMAHLYKANQTVGNRGNLQCNISIIGITNHQFSIDNKFLLDIFFSGNIRHIVTNNIFCRTETRVV